MTVTEERTKSQDLECKLKNLEREQLSTARRCIVLEQDVELLESRLQKAKGKLTSLKAKKNSVTSWG